MKTLSLALAGTALISTLATTANAVDCGYSGFYMGGQIGVGMTNTEVKYNRPAQNASFLGVPIALEDEHDKDRFAATGITGGIHVGMGKHFPNRFYLGIEASANLYGNSETKHAADKIKIQRNNSFGVAFLPGTTVGNTVFFAILGLESTQYKYSVERGTGNSKYAGTKKNRLWGFKPGLGMEVFLNKNVKVGVRGTMTLNKSSTVTAAPVTAGASAVNNSTKFQTQALDLVTTVSYKW